MLKTKFILCIVFVSAVCIVQNSHARRNTLTGGLTIGYDSDKTNYERSGLDNDETGTPIENDQIEQFSIAALCILETTSSIDNLTIRFNPSFVYDLEDSQQEIDNNFLISAYRDFTRRLRVETSDQFISSDDPELIEQENSSDYIRNRRRYWTNVFNLNSTYSYGLASSAGAGYSYDILRNEDTDFGGYEDYDRHIADITVQHQFNAAWNIIATGSYTRGLFDPPDPEVVEVVGEGLEQIAPGSTDDIDGEGLSNDLSEYRADAGVNWIYSQQKTFLLNYSFLGTNYDAILRDDSNLHELTAGVQNQYTRRLFFELGGGPSVETSETFDTRWGYNAFLGFNYDIARNTSIGASATKGYDIENFSADNNPLGRNQGLTSFWECELNLSHQFTSDLTANLFAAYRDEDQENLLYGLVSSVESEIDLETIDGEIFREESSFNRKIYGAGGSLGYNFWTWFTAAIQYTYRKQESDLINDSYDEHRVYLTLSMEKELLRW